MKISNTSLLTQVKVRSRNNETQYGNPYTNFAMLDKYLYGTLNRYKLKEYYIKYIKALYED